MRTSKPPAPNFDVVGIGAATLDILSVVDRFPESDSVQQAYTVKLSGGGPVATAICSASRLGLKTALIDSIGDDWAGERILDDLRASKIDTRLVTVNRGACSSVSTILVRRRDGSRAISFIPASVPCPGVPPDAASAIASARVLHINGRHPEACRSAIAIARQYGTRISFDGGAGRYRQEIADLFAAANYPIVAKDFATSATGIREPGSAAQELSKSPETEFAIVTDGIRGSWLAIGGAKPSHQPAIVTHSTIDTTGAGDVFHGAFLAAILHGASLHDSHSFASAAASLSTEYLGGREALSDSGVANALLAKISR